MSALTGEQVERVCSRLMAGDPRAAHDWLHTDAALRAQLEAQSVTYQDNLTEIQLLKQGRDKLRQCYEDLDRISEVELAACEQERDQFRKRVEELESALRIHLTVTPDEQALAAQPGKRKT